MSEDSEVPKLKSQELKIAVSENSDETRKTIKRNYCYVCDVQCTALKNYIVHQKGRKHLKKLKLKEDIEKQKLKQDQIIKTRNSIIKKSLESSSIKTNEQNSKDFKFHEANDSISGISNSDDKSMSNSKRQTPKYNKNHYNNFNNQNNYSRHQNSRYSYSNHYEGDRGYFYNERPKSAYTTRWRSTNYQIPPPVHNSFNNYQYRPGGQYYSDPRYNAPFENEYFSGNRNASFMSQDYADQRSLPFSSAESENSVYSFLREEISDVQESESSSIPSRNANKSNSKDWSNSLCTSETINSEQGSLNTSNQFSASKTATNKNVDSSLSNQISDSSKSKVGENKRLRTRSLSSAESTNNDKKLKDKNEILSADSEGMPDQQKLKEYTTSLLETNPNRISLMIQHPSSHKEKAVLNHIMTSFSKTRRKENLTRKLRSNSLGSAGNNDDATLDIHSVSSESDEVSVIFPSEVTPTQTSSESDKSKCHLSSKKNGSNSDDLQSSELFFLLSKKDSKSTNSSQVLLDNQSTKKNGKNGRSKENSILSKNKGSERRKEKNSEEVYPKKTVKRKSYDDDKSNKSKKQRSSDGRNLDMSCLSKNIEQKDLNKDMTPVSSVNLPSDIQITPVSHPETVPVKEEVTDCAHINEVPSVTELPKTTDNQNLDYNSQISVETLIELFASGNVTVKKEFNDPVIDAIKGVDPNELIFACSEDSRLKSIAETNPMTAESNVIGSMSSTPVPNISLQENTNCINPVILGSTVDSDNITPVSRIQRTATPPSPAPTEVSRDQNFSSLSDASEKDSLSDVEKLNLISRTKTEFPHLITMIEKLQEISSQEETVKESIFEAKSKINEYSNLLEEWKNKKKKLHNEEEELRKKRIDIIQLMQNAIKIPHDASSDETKTEFLHEAHTTLGKANQEQNTVQANKNTEISHSLMSSSLPKAHGEKQKSKCSVSDEILILPSPVKLQPPEIIIVDDTEESSMEIQSKKNSVGAGEIVPNFPNQGSSLYDTKNLTAHSTVVNCIVVFEDFVYTCSNDNTAKRYSLMDTSQSVVYLHAAKNVTEIAVEKVQNEALVFTSCSNKMLSLFIASNGTKIKTFFESSPIKSICKGWGKFYAGMEDGTVNVYNWKYEEKEFAKTQNPAYRIATVHQGGLHVLIILSTDGHVSLRDAKTSLLIRFIKTSVKFPAWLTVHNDFVYLSSSDRTISVLDIQSGKVERKMQINVNNATGLAVCDDNIFTISYSGIISCVNKDKFSDLTLFYGAGKNGLTCIHVYQNWVFTGNRQGDISVFHFDPLSRFSCKIGKCRSTYGSREDLAFHFELQHLKKKNLAFCQWEKCPFIFPVNYSTTDKINHLKRHILLVPRGSTV